MKSAALILIGIAALALLALYKRHSWSQFTASLSERVRNDASLEYEHVNFNELAAIPPVVQHYFRNVLREDAFIINYIHLSQNGGFRARPDAEKWSKMEAQQYFSTRPRAFVWDASIAAGGGLRIRVADAYIDGHGQMKGRLSALFTLIDAHDRRELDEGALQRYLAEAVWFPTALLPSQGVQWSTIDAHRAKATLSDGGHTVSLEFTFNDEGEIVSAYAPERYREKDGTYRPTPWQCNYEEYIEAEGYRIPSQGTAQWLLDDGPYPYWKAALSEIRYD